MWIYEKMLQYPVRVSRPDPRLATLLREQYGGGDGELSASLQYMNQRYTMPTNSTKGLLTDIATEELGHLEMLAAMIFQLTADADKEAVLEGGMLPYYADHGKALFYANAAGVPWSAHNIGAKDDPIADLQSDMAAEQRARATYNHLMDFTDDPGVLDALRFLREREIVHFQRFGEAKRTRWNREMAADKSSKNKQRLTSRK